MIVWFSVCTVNVVMQIADFGMSRDLMYESYYISHGGMIPVKWTAPEVNFQITNVKDLIKGKKVN